MLLSPRQPKWPDCMQPMRPTTRPMCLHRAPSEWPFSYPKAMKRRLSPPPVGPHRCSPSNPLWLSCRFISCLPGEARILETWPPLFLSPCPLFLPSQPLSDAIRKGCLLSKGCSLRLTSSGCTLIEKAPPSTLQTINAQVDQALPLPHHPQESSGLDAERWKGEMEGRAEDRC